MKRRLFLGHVVAGVLAVLAHPWRLLARPAPAAWPGKTRPRILRVGRIYRDPETGGIVVTGWCLDSRGLADNACWTIEELEDVARNPAKYGLSNVGSDSDPVGLKTVTESYPTS
jgi:hypothetical protein